MNKKVIIKLCEDNSVEVECGEIKKTLTNNMLSASTIYELLDYKCGDTYIIETKILGTKDEIIVPLKTLFDNLKSQIEALPSVSSQIEKELQNLNTEGYVDAILD